MQVAIPLDQSRERARVARSKVCTNERRVQRQFPCERASSRGMHNECDESRQVVRIVESSVQTPIRLVVLKPFILRCRFKFAHSRVYVHTSRIQLAEDITSSFFMRGKN